jgi:hypothetical protein
MGREGDRQTNGRRGARVDRQSSPYHFLNRGDAYKPVSTAKLMAQEPNCKFLHKNSVFSVSIIVRTSII